MKELHTIGFDAKRAAQNRTGLGNYSRFVIRGLSRCSDVERLLLYVPNPNNMSALEGLEQEQRVRFRFPPESYRWPRSLWRVWSLSQELPTDGVQLYHGLSNELPLNIRRAPGVRTVVTIHDLIFLRYPHYYKPIDRWIYHYKFRRACEQADRIIAVSECTKRDIIHFFDIPEDKIDVVYQGCDERFRQAISSDKKEEVRVRYQLPTSFILYVGSIEERKNLMLLARALPILQNKDIHVIAVGRRTPYADDIDQFIHANHLSDRFRMLSGVPFADLPAFYQLADVFVYPSRFEGFGIPLLEALCSGTPAVGCTGSCLEEAGGPSSRYVNPDDEHELATAIDSILSDHALRQQMIADGKDHAAHFHVDALTQELLKTYQRTLNL